MVDPLSSGAIGRIIGGVLACILFFLIITLFLLLYQRRKNHPDHSVVTHAEINDAKQGKDGDSSDDSMEIVGTGRINFRVEEIEQIGARLGNGEEPVGM